MQTFVTMHAYQQTVELWSPLLFRINTKIYLLYTVILMHSLLYSFSVKDCPFGLVKRGSNVACIIPSSSRVIRVREAVSLCPQRVIIKTVMAFVLADESCSSVVFLQQTPL